MAWDEDKGGPWDNDPKKDNPWSRRGGSRRDENDIDEMIDKFQGRIKGMMNGNGGSGLPSSGKVPFYLAGILLGLYLLTGFYRVDEGELAVVLRFGKVERVVGPGLHYYIPAPIESKIVKKVDAINRIDGDLKGSSSSAQSIDQKLILTGDENMVITDYSVLWKIKDIEQYLFVARNPDETIKIAAESALREVIGQTTSRAALTEGRDLIADHTQKLLQQLMDEYKMGIKIEGFKLQRVEPPKEVLEAYLDVQASLVDADRLKNEAEAYSNDILPRARGGAVKLIQAAEAAKQEEIDRAKGEAASFNKVREAYAASPKVTKQREFLSRMQRALAESSLYIVDSQVASKVLPHIPMADLNKHSDKKKGE